jgi:DNA-binding response OmpR family regulator
LFSQREFDLVLLDVMMPGVDGFEVSRQLRQTGNPKRVPVVFITVKDDAESMREGFRSGGSIFLSKPFTAVQLAKLVRSLIGG